MKADAWVAINELVRTKGTFHGAFGDALAAGTAGEDSAILVTGSTHPEGAGGFIVGRFVEGIGRALWFIPIGYGVMFRQSEITDLHSQSLQGSWKSKVRFMVGGLQGSWNNSSRSGKREDQGS